MEFRRVLFRSLPNIVQRVLLGELRERDAEPRAVAAIAGDDDGLQCRRSELMLRSVASGLANPVADLYLAETPELSDRARGDGQTLDGGPAFEDRDRGHLVLEIAAE